MMVKYSTYTCPVTLLTNAATKISRVIHLTGGKSDTLVAIVCSLKILVRKNYLNLGIYIYKIYCHE